MVFVEREVKNIYIWWYKWIPWENTLAYFPFKDDLLDHSWNGVALRYTQYLTQQTLWYKWQFSQGSAWNSIWAWFDDWNAKFISIWYNIISSSWNSWILSLNKYWCVWYNSTHWTTSLSWKIAIFSNSSWAVWATADWMTFNAWHHLTMWYDGSKVLISKDGVQTTLYNWTGYNFGDTINIVWWWNNTNMNALVSEFICESECWNAAEISNYYNSTKANYWIS